jgi:hypothetical protein
MAFIATAIIGGAVIGGLAAKSAANKTASAANQANQSIDARYQTMRSDETPYMTAGAESTGRLRDLLGTSGNVNAPGYGSLTSTFTPQDYLDNQDPGYGFMLRQGEQMVQNRNAAQSGALSGAALKDLASYGEEYAKTGYQAAYDRWNTTMSNTYARLAGISTLGQNAATQTGSQGVAVGQQQSANTVAAANAGAAATVAGGNLLGQAGSDYALLNSINPKPPTSGGAAYSGAPGAYDYSGLPLSMIKP